MIIILNMINIWMILVLSATLIMGTMAFFNKVFSQQSYHPKSIVILTSFVFFISSFLYSVYFQNFSISVYEIAISIMYGIQMYIISLLMIYGLKKVPTSTYLISLRLISSLSLLVIGILFFSRKYFIIRDFRIHSRNDCNIIFI